MSIFTRSIPVLAATATLGLSAAPALAHTTARHGAQGSGQSTARDHNNARGHGSRGVRACGLDRAWLKHVAQADLAEIATGTLAQQKGTSQGVKDLGAMLVADHTKHLQQVQALAGRFGATVPTAPSPSQQWEAAVLATFSGTAFDQQWTAAQIADHLTNIDQTQDEIADGCNRDVRALANMTLPTLQAHLAAAQKLAGTGTTSGTTNTTSGTGNTSGTGTASGAGAGQSNCDSSHDATSGDGSSYSSGRHHGDGCCSDDDSGDSSSHA
jgi:predicted outer membrane protein